MWRARVPDPVQVKLFKAARERFDLRPLAIHANYLINLASLDPTVRANSIAAFRGEMERAIAIGAEYLVVHPGSSKGQSVEDSIRAVALGLNEAAEKLRISGLTVLLENTAGSGACLGSRLEELRSLREAALELTYLPIGYCLDTCHLLAAGFDIASEAGLRSTILAIQRSIGLAHVHLIHANDSKTPRGSRVDRHAHIGAGHIGPEGFRRILTHPQLRRKPFILETPIDNPGDDRRNLETLKRLADRFESQPRRDRAARN